MTEYRVRCQSGKVGDTSRIIDCEEIQITDGVVIFWDGSATRRDSSQEFMVPVGRLIEIDRVGREE